MRLGRRAALVGSLAVGSVGLARRAAAAVPVGATDCHFFIYDHRYPSAPGARLLPPDATTTAYQALQARLGLSRGVLVQPSTYGTDNALQLASMEALGRDRFRMIAVVPEEVPDAELRRLNGLGVRGVRFNLAEPGPLSLASLPVLAPRLAALGWVCQVNLTASQIAEAESVLSRLPGRVVIDHLGHVAQPAGVDSPSYTSMRRLLDSGRVYMKLSGAYMSSKEGPPGYADAGRVASAFVRAAPERVLWGSDWPHPTVVGTKPDDGVLLELLAQWAGSPAALKQVLVDNPAGLYGFGPG